MRYLNIKSQIEARWNLNKKTWNLQHRLCSRPSLPHEFSPSTLSWCILYKYFTFFNLYSAEETNYILLIYHGFHTWPLGSFSSTCRAAWKTRHLRKHRYSCAGWFKTDNNNNNNLIIQTGHSHGLLLLKLFHGVRHSQPGMVMVMYQLSLMYHLDRQSQLLKWGEE